jgi:hypothetical protein
MCYIFIMNTETCNQIAEDLGITYSGPVFGLSDEIIGHLHDDDRGRGGSFLVTNNIDTTSVFNALREKRIEFLNAKTN